MYLGTYRSNIESLNRKNPEEYPPARKTCFADSFSVKLKQNLVTFFVAVLSLVLVLQKVRPNDFILRDRTSNHNGKNMPGYTMYFIQSFNSRDSTILLADPSREWKLALTWENHFSRKMLLINSWVRQYSAKTPFVHSLFLITEEMCSLDGNVLSFIMKFGTVVWWT